MRLVLAVGIGVVLLVAGLATDTTYLIVFSAIVLLPSLLATRTAFRRNSHLREAIARGRGA